MFSLPVWCCRPQQLLRCHDFLRLRSPRISDAGNTNLTYYVLPGGTASNYLVHYSYGKSPNTRFFADSAWYITSEGEPSMVTEGLYYDSYERKYAEHEFLPRLESPSLWHRHARRLQPCQQFLRVKFNNLDRRSRSTPTSRGM